MSEEPEPVHPVGEALTWLGRIFAVMVVMLAPGYGGSWLDERWGTNYLALAGFAFGFIIGLFYLITVARAAADRDKSSGRRQDGE